MEGTIESAVECFKKHNLSWENMTVVMSDKEFGERNVFKKCFPEVLLQICLFHALRSFKREITMEKMGITSDERS